MGIYRHSNFILGLTKRMLTKNILGTCFAAENVKNILLNINILNILETTASQYSENIVLQGGGSRAKYFQEIELEKYLLLSPMTSNA